MVIVSLDTTKMLQSLVRLTLAGLATHAKMVATRLGRHENHCNKASHEVGHEHKHQLAAGIAVIANLK